MWPFPKKEPGIKAHLVSLDDGIATALQRIKHLEDGILALEDKHERLRGRFYATRPQEGAPVTESKAEILKRMGFMR